MLYDSGQVNLRTYRHLNMFRFNEKFEELLFDQLLGVREKSVLVHRQSSQPPQNRPTIQQQGDNSSLTHTH